MHEIASDLHETKSDAAKIVLHEIESDLSREMHEIKSEFWRIMHETESEFRKELHEIKSELVEETAMRMAWELMRAAQIR